MVVVTKDLYAASIALNGTAYKQFNLATSCHLVGLSIMYSGGGWPNVGLYRGSKTVYADSDKRDGIFVLDINPRAGASYPLFSYGLIQACRTYCSYGPYTLLVFGATALAYVHIILDFE